MFWSLQFFRLHGGFSEQVKSFLKHLLGFALGIGVEILFALFLRAKRLEQKARSNAQIISE